MMENEALRERLIALSADLAYWRVEADRLFERAGKSGERVDDDLLLSVEETASRLYQGVKVFEALKADTEAASHIAGGELAEVGEAIRLLLLEVTEFGIQLYSSRSESVSLRTVQ